MRILFAGTPDFAAAHLKGLLEAGVDIVAVISQPDKPGKRGKKPVPGEVKRLALSNNLALIQPAKIEREHLLAFDADLLIVVAYGQILGPDVLETPRFGCINVHASLLPRWRGAAPIQRAILAGDKETGVCIMQMDQGLDTGGVLMKKSIPITTQDTSASLQNNLAEIGISSLIDIITQIENGTVQSAPQSEDGISYAKKIDKKEAICDWNKSSLEVSRTIRAFFPTPVAYTYLDQLRVKIHQAKILEESGRQGNPGEVLEVSREGVAIACGRGSLLVQRLQLPLGKGSVLSGADIINSRADLIACGTRFGI